MVGLGCGWHRAQFDHLAIRVDPAEVNLAYGKAVAASSVWDADHVAANAADGDGFTTRWSAAGGKTAGEWLEVDLGQPMRFDSVTLRPFDERIKGYKVQAWDGANWGDAYVGKQLGPHPERRQFPAVTARRVRLLVTEAKEPPSLWEIEVRNGP